MSCICVVGMHRSGTSCLTGIMQQLGVELGEVFTQNLYNKRGNRESGRIVALNDALLAANGGAWNNPVIVQHWTRQQASERDAIVKELTSRGSDHWGFKDPRTLFTLNFWREAIPAPRFIGTIRHPHRVALSLSSRDRSPLEQGWELWYRYNQCLLELASTEHFPITDFDQPDDIYLQDVISKLLSLGIKPELAASASNFFDPSLRNQAGQPVDDVKLPDRIVKLYSQLLDYARKPAV